MTCPPPTPPVWPSPAARSRKTPTTCISTPSKGNMVAVVSNGTAVLGLGDIGPEAGLPVMEGKAVLFKEFGGVDAFPICIDAHDAASVIAACQGHCAHLWRHQLGGYQEPRVL